MASLSAANPLAVTINFDMNRTVLYLQRDMKIGTAIQKAAEAFKVPPQGLTFLYHSNVITDDMTVGDALGLMQHVTVIHLIRVTSKKTTTATIMPFLDGRPREILFGHCKGCTSLVVMREVFQCPNYSHNHKNDSLFQRSTGEPINHFSFDDVQQGLLMGACSTCNDDALVAELQYECRNCKTRDAACFLRMIRDNIEHKIKCMKCGLVKDINFRFACVSRHCICLDCFGYWCRLQLNADNFRNFDNLGFSIGCPGPDPSCARSPVMDPHHFKVVDDDQVFYERYHNLALEKFQPPGNEVYCIKCKGIVGNGKNTVVTEPEGMTVSGLRWYHRLFGITPAPPSPRKRRRTFCSQCTLTYCDNCKQVWHNGDCRKMDNASIRDEKAFPISPILAIESCWPQGEN